MPLSRDKLLLVDDDPCFSTIISAVARQHDFEPHIFSSLVEMGSFARIRDFDVALIDYYLDMLRGDEIAEYVDTFFGDIPVLIVSSRDFAPEEIAKWPQAVRRFVSKTEGAEAIVAAARSVLDRERLLKRLAEKPPTDAKVIDTI